MFRYLTCGLLLVILAACINLGGSSPATRYFLLSSRAESPAAPGAVADNPLFLEIAPVAIAPFLDRSQLVSRQDNRLLLANNALWGEPLRDGVARVVGDNLERLHPGLRSSGTMMGPDEHRLILYLEVRRLDGRPEEGATMAIRWSLQDPATGGQQGAGEFYSERSAMADYAALVEDYGSGLADLSRRIASRLP